MMLLLGSEGRIGLRYQSILRELEIPWVGFDLIDRPVGTWKEWKDLSFDQVLIATPTFTHVGLCHELLDMKKSFLCEKPLSTDLAECEVLRTRAKNEKASAYVVNNYSFVMPSDQPIRSLEWDYFNSGQDGFEWDLCQIIYLGYKNNASLQLHQKSPLWNMRVNGDSINYRRIELSYLDMIGAFYMKDREHLWNLYDGQEMTKAVLRYQREKKF